jgi:transcription antitermination factor NusG
MRLAYLELQMIESFSEGTTELGYEVNTGMAIGPKCAQGWYAAYISANHEKKVSRQLQMKRVVHYLPVYRSVRRWKDRRVNLEMPLFPGYVFVRTALQDRLDVLRVPGVACLVSFTGVPAEIPASEIESLRASLNGGFRVEPHPYLLAGRKVILRSGPLEGLTGIVVRRKNITRFVITVNLIQRAVAVELDEADLEAAL